MTIEATAVYVNGSLLLTQPLPLDEQQLVRLRIETDATPDPERMSVEEFKAILNEIAADAPPNVAPLPAEFSRADCYDDERG